MNRMKTRKTFVKPLERGGIKTSKLMEEDISKSKINGIIKKHSKRLREELINSFLKEGAKTTNFNRIYYQNFRNAIREIGGINKEGKNVMDELKTFEREEVSNLIYEFENSIDSAFREAGITKNRSKNQLPDFAFASNSEINLDAIFYDFSPKVKDREQVAGTFGNSVAVRKEKHLEGEEDFTQFAYILNHNSHEKKPIPFLMFLTETNNKDYLKLIIKRRDTFLKYAYDAGWRVEMEKNNDYVVMKRVGDEIKKTLLPIVLYDADSREFQVYHTRGENKGKKEDLKEWVLRNKDIIGLKLSDYLIKKLDEHKKDIYASEVHKLRRLYQKVACVDSRHRCYIPSELLKELGSIPKEKEIRRMFKHNYTNLISIELHTTCGYITSAVMFHDLFTWIKNNGSESLKHAVKKQIENFIASTNSGKEYKMILANEFKELIKDAGEDVRKAYSLLFENDKSDYQFILKHMIDVGLFKREEGFPIMNSAKKVDKALNEKMAKIDGKYRIFLITEEIGRWLKNRIEKIREKEIEEGNENAINVKFEVVMRSLVSDELIKIPNEIKISKSREVKGNDGEYFHSKITELI